MNYIHKNKLITNRKRLGTVAQSVAMPLGIQAVPRSIPASSTFFCEYLVMVYFYVAIFPLFLIQEMQLMAKECILNTGKLPLGGLLWNSVIMITDHPDMTSVENRIKNIVKFSVTRHINILTFCIIFQAINYQQNVSTINKDLFANTEL